MEILIISGLSGAGKSRAAICLEDGGYYIVDNLPAEMMVKFAEFCEAAGGRYDRLAFVYDVRAGEPFQRLTEAVDEIRAKGLRCRLLFLEADTKTIINRYKETRRCHPLCGDGCSIEDAVARERAMLEPVRSRAEESILAELHQLAAAGYREVVLSAISLPSYGLDTGTNLVELVEKCAQVPGIERIRLGSLDPDMLTPEFISRLAAVDKLCPQFHLSLQSGCTVTLRRMRRVYTAQEYATVVEQIRAAYGSRPVSFTTDCICGFPGETAEDFEESCAFLKKIGFLKVHVFPYSRRSGTPAYDFPDQIHEREKQERSRRMNAVAEQVRCEALAAFEGTEDEVLLETPLSGTLFTGYTRLYIPVVVSAPGCESGQIVRVKLGRYDGERVRAALC